MKKNIICIIGPTASGKTDLAIALTKELSTEIISVDSAMLYTGMDIGTAKPTATELLEAPHRLIDICDPAEKYSVGRFLHDVNNEIAAIFEHKKTPLLVGGTMMYFHVLQNGFSQLPAADLMVREKINAEALAEGWDKMHAKLSAIDAVAAKNIHSNDPQRIQRALEVYYSTGIPISEFHKVNRSDHGKYNFINIALMPNKREALHEKIKVRLDKMLQLGFFQEVEGLFSRGDLNSDLPSIRTVGYRQIWSHLQGEISFSTAVEKALFATRQLAKRQITWLRRWKNLNVIASESDKKIDAALKILGIEGS